MRTHLAWALLLVGACSGDGSNEKVTLVNGAGGDGNGAADGNGDGNADGSGDGSDGNGDGDGAGDGADGSSDGNDGSGDGTGSADGIDPKDPPTPAEACGDDLDAHNGAVIPDFGKVPNGDTFAGDPIDNGPLKVVLADAKLPNPNPGRDDYDVTTYGPSTDGSTLDAGPFPLIVLLPGFSGVHTAYRHFIDHFVSHGVAVLGVTPKAGNPANNPADVNEVIHALDWAIKDSPLAGKIDETKLAVSGHSEGGKIAFFSAVTDSRFKLVIGWDPENGGGPPCFVANITGGNCDMWPVAPVCDKDRKFEDSGMMANIRAETMVFAARDGTITPDKHLWAENFYRGAPSPAHLALFPNAGHGDWATAGATTDISKRVQMALVLTRFFGKKGLDKYLPDGDYLKGESSVEVHNK